MSINQKKTAITGVVMAAIGALLGDPPLCRAGLIMIGIACCIEEW